MAGPYLYRRVVAAMAEFLTQTNDGVLCCMLYRTILRMTNEYNPPAPAELVTSI